MTSDAVTPGVTRALFQVTRANNGCGPSGLIAGGTAPASVRAESALRLLAAFRVLRRVQLEALLFAAERWRRPPGTSSSTACSASFATTVPRRDGHSPGSSYDGNGLRAVTRPATSSLLRVTPKASLDGADPANLHLNTPSRARVSASRVPPTARRIGALRRDQVEMLLSGRLDAHAVTPRTGSRPLRTGQPRRPPVSSAVTPPFLRVTGDDAFSAEIPIDAGGTVACRPSRAPTRRTQARPFVAAWATGGRTPPPVRLDHRVGAPCLLRLITRVRV